MSLVCRLCRYVQRKIDAECGLRSPPLLGMPGVSRPAQGIICKEYFPRFLVVGYWWQG